MIQAIIILSLVVIGLCVSFIRQLKKTWAATAQLRQYDHAIKAFEGLEGKIGELERYYDKKRKELENANDSGTIADILNGMQNRVYSPEDHTPIDSRRKTGGKV